MLFLAMATALCNEATAPELRGRVMALFAVAFLGSTPIGGPILGLVTESLGPRAGLALGAVTALSTGLAACAFVRRAHHSVPLRALPVEIDTRAAQVGRASTTDHSPRQIERVRAQRAHVRDRPQDGYVFVR
jgi:MFS family permease